MGAEAIVCLGERHSPQSGQSHLATQNLDNQDNSLFRMTSESSKSLYTKTCCPPSTSFPLPCSSLIPAGVHDVSFAIAGCKFRRVRS